MAHFYFRIAGHGSHLDAVGKTEMEKKLRRLTLICALVWCLANPTGIHAQKYVFHSYQQSEGLKNLAVNALAKDRQGYLWVATENGVYRFLGSKFEQFGREQGIAELDVLNVIADPAGTIWVFTDENMYRWDGQHFLTAWQNPIRISSPQSVALQDASHLVAVEDADHLLVIEQNRLFRLEHDNQGKVLSRQPVFTDSAVASNPDLGNVFSVSVVNPSSSTSRVWIGCGEKLYSWTDGGSRATPRDGRMSVWGQEQNLPHDDWQAVHLARDGVLWAGGQKHVVALLPGSARFVDRSIPGSHIQSVYGFAPLIEDQDGKILVPTEDGISRWNGVGWQKIGKANGLIHNGRILSMIFDTAGDLWIGSKGDGLTNWTGYRDWAGWGEGQGLPSASVWSIIADRPDRVFVGTDKGPAWIDPQTGLSGPLVPGSMWTYGQVGSMGLNRDGSLWAATFSGAILRIDRKTGRAVQTSRLSAVVAVGIQDPAGRLLLGTNKGIFESEAQTGAAPHHLPGVEKLLGENATAQAACETPDGAVWFLIKNRLLRERDGKWSAPPILGLSKLHGTLLSLSAAPDGTLWIAGDQDGLWHIKVDNESLHASHLELPLDLRALAPVAILADRKGWVWVGTDAGLVVWNGHDWRHLTQETGLVWNDLDQNSLRMAGDGSLWIGTSGGVAHLLHPEHVFDPIPLVVSVSEISHGSDLYTGEDQITLPWPGTPLHFQVTTPVTRNRSELRLKIWMVGLQPNWLDTENGIATFTSLSPGDYTFMTMSCNPAFQECSGVAKVKVRILPPWWRSYWFYALCALAFLLLLLLGDRVRIHSLRRIRDNLERLVHERTKELEDSREQLRIQATYDGQTGMLNHTAVLRVLAAEMERAHRDKKTLVLAMADLDHFKRVNDVFGHLSGDEALRCFAAAVKSAIRPYDHAGRYGGEEFLFILPEIPPEMVEQRLASLHSSISNIEVRAEQSKFTITCSMGATIYVPSMESLKAESLLAIADQALYDAKGAGRNRVIYHVPRLPFQ